MTCDCGGECWWCRRLAEMDAAETEVARGPKRTPSPEALKRRNPLAWWVSQRTGLPFCECAEALAAGRTVHEILEGVGLRAVS